MVMKHSSIQALLNARDVRMRQKIIDISFAFFGGARMRQEIVDISFATHSLETVFINN